MKLITKIALFVLTVGSVKAATVTLQISNGTNNATGFADASGSTAPGLVWGIIASADTTYQTLSPGLVLSTTTDGTALGNGDFLFLSTNLTVDQTFGAETGVGGKITNITGIQVNLGAGGANSVATGYSYAVVWFNRGIAVGDALEAGDSYGIITDPNFVIPASGATANHSAGFAGVNDPIKRANSVTLVIPEPSVALLGAIGALGILRRRRD